VLTKFWEGLGGKLGEQWSAALVAPAAIFWAGGLGLWILDKGWSDSGRRIVDWFAGLSGAEQGLVAVGALLALAGSAIVVDLLTLPVVRLLEGYWPTGFHWLRRRLTDRRSAKVLAKETELQALAAKLAKEGLTADEQTRFVQLDVDLRRIPTAPEQRLPTRLGNVLRSAETWPRAKYGLDPVVAWPRLWLVLDDDVKKELVEARQRLDQAVATFIWGVLLVVWLFLSWLAFPAALAVCAFGYWWAVRAAEVFADLVEAVYDVFRPNLYTKLRLPAPERPADEAAFGEQVTAYLWRGEASDLRFEPPATPDEIR
jgi:hypothetical protein